MVDVGQVEMQGSTTEETAPLPQNLGQIFCGKEAYPRLPSKLNIGDKLLCGIDQLRPNNTSLLVERGGVLLQTPNNEIIIIECGKPGETFELRAQQITDEDVEEYIKSPYMLFHKDKPTNDMIIVEWPVLDRNRAYFKSLMDKGMKVLMGTKLGAIHSHPSGNLPSPFDVGQALYTHHERKESEVVVTNGWSYFLIPSLQTPDLWETDEDMEMLLTLLESDQEVWKQQESGSYAPGEGPITTYRYKMIQDLCQEYCVGFYTLKEGEKTAQRVF